MYLDLWYYVCCLKWWKPCCSHLCANRLKTIQYDFFYTCSFHVCISFGCLWCVLTRTLKAVAKKKKKKKPKLNHVYQWPMWFLSLLKTSYFQISLESKRRPICRFEYSGKIVPIVLFCPVFLSYTTVWTINDYLYSTNDLSYCCAVIIFISCLLYHMNLCKTCWNTVF